jgi:hypothetical protein
MQSEQGLSQWQGNSLGSEEQGNFFVEFGAGKLWGQWEVGKGLGGARAQFAAGNHSRGGRSRDSHSF